MKTVGIVCEYNPFHTGHEYHIARAKEITGADAVVCVMSGNFMQRGDVAIFDKHTRAKAALLTGADLVIELPVVYALSCAEKFAYGAVSILDAVGVDFVCFGAECDNIKTLEKLADALYAETDEFKACISKNLKEGLSYQKSRDIALKEVLNINPAHLSKPNNALAIEYLKALKKLSSKSEPVAIKRIGEGYNSQKLSENSFSSASGIRNSLKKEYDIEKVNEFLPPATHVLYKDKTPVFRAALDEIVLYKLRTTSKEELRNINDVAEGIENRILKAAGECKSFEEIVDCVSGKRYTKSRASRIILSALLDIKKEDVKKAEYIRVLGMSKMGTKVISDIKKTCPMEVITKLAAYKKESDMLKKDILASNIYAILSGGQAGSDFKTSPAVIDKNETHYVYIIKCADDSLYCGWTNNLEKRFEAHKAGKGAKYTKGRGPLELVYYEEFNNKSDALKREIEIKQLSRAEKDKLIKG